MRIERHLLSRFVGLTAVLAALATAVVAAVWPWLVAARVRPSPWSLAPLIAYAAALWTARRTRALGEHVSVASTGVSRFALVWPCVVATVVLELCAALPGGERSAARPEARSRTVVLRGVEGGLWLLPADPDAPSWFWPAGAEWPDPVAGAPAAFVAEPHDRGRFRRQLFLVHSPLWPSEHPLDPTPWRWVWFLWGGAAVWWVLGNERGGARHALPLLLWIPIAVFV